MLRHGCLCRSENVKYSVREIADILDMTPDTVRNVINRFSLVDGNIKQIDKRVNNGRELKLSPMQQ